MKKLSKSMATMGTGSERRYLFRYKLVSSVTASVRIVLWGAYN